MTIRTNESYKTENYNFIILSCHTDRHLHRVRYVTSILS